MVDTFGAQSVKRARMLHHIALAEAADMLKVPKGALSPHAGKRRAPASATKGGAVGSPGDIAIGIRAGMTAGAGGERERRDSDLAGLTPRRRATEVIVKYLAENGYTAAATQIQQQAEGIEVQVDAAAAGNAAAGGSAAGHSDGDGAASKSTTAAAAAAVEQAGEGTDVSDGEGRGSAQGLGAGGGAAGKVDGEGGGGGNATGDADGAEVAGSEGKEGKVGKEEKDSGPREVQEADLKGAEGRTHGGEGKGEGGVASEGMESKEEELARKKLLLATPSLATVGRVSSMQFLKKRTSPNHSRVSSMQFLGKLTRTGSGTFGRSKLGKSGGSPSKLGKKRPLEGGSGTEKPEEKPDAVSKEGGD
jgi:hypothetical protein